MPTDPPPRTPPRFDPPPRDPRRAAVLMVAASGLVAGTTLLAKAVGSGALGPALHPLQLSFGRFLFAFLAISAVVAVLRPRLHPPAWGLHLGRTLCGWGGTTLLFAAVAFLPLSDATALSFLSPVVTMLLAIALLRERVGPVRWSAAAIAVLGMLILLRPGPESFQPAAFLALAAAAALGFEAIVIKWLTARERPLQILFVNNGLGTAVAGLAALAVWQVPTPLQWAALAGIGGLMVAGQACYLWAMRVADASFVAPLFYLTLAFATLYDFAVFGVVPDAISLAGAVVLVSGAALIAWREGRRRG